VVAALVAPLAPAVPDAESVLDSSVFRNTLRGKSGGWPVLCISWMLKTGHPFGHLQELLRNTRASCTKAHTPEDDDARPDRRLPPFPR